MVSTSAPKGVTQPMPVTTTRRLMASLLRRLAAAWAAAGSRLPSAAWPTSNAPKQPHHPQKRLRLEQAAQAGIVQVGEDDLRLGVQHVALVAGGGDHRPFFADVLDRGGVGERVAGHGLAVEHGLGHLGQHHLLGELVVLADQQPARLRHALDHQRVGDHRVAGEVVVQVVLGQRDVLDGLGVPPALELDEPIDPVPSHGTLDSPPVQWKAHSVTSTLLSTKRHMSATVSRLPKSCTTGFLAKSSRLANGIRLRSSASPSSVTLPS